MAISVAFSAPTTLHVGLGEDVVDRARKVEADQKRGEKRVERPDQPHAQLDEVIHQRRLGGVDVLGAHSAAPRARRGVGGRLLDDFATALRGAPRRCRAAAIAGAPRQLRRQPSRRRFGQRHFGEADVLGPSTAWVISWRIAIAGSNAAPILADSSRAVEFLLDALEIGLLHRLHELALEFGRHAPHLADCLADRAHDARQILRRNHREGDDAEDQELADVKIEHGAVRPHENLGEKRCGALPARRRALSARRVS